MKRASRSAAQAVNRKHITKPVRPSSWRCPALNARMAGATPKETVSAIESYSIPNLLVARARRATRPSIASQSAASTMPSAARSYLALKECTMAQKPKKSPAVVTRCGSR